MASTKERQAAILFTVGAFKAVENDGVAKLRVLHAMLAPSQRHEDQAACADYIRNLREDADMARIDWALVVKGLRKMLAAKISAEDAEEEKA